MGMVAYINRVADTLLDKALEAAGGVVIEGPRFCGKTTTAKQRAKSSVEFDKDTGMLAIAQTDPSEAIKGPVPRLLDEWQLAPMLWNTVRHEIDAREDTGQFILTGSAVPRDDVSRHSGAGRIVRIPMETMTLAEAGISSAEVSLCALFDGEAKPTATGGRTIGEYVEFMTHGGWPRLLKSSTDAARIVLEGYVDEISRVDINKPQEAKHDPVRVRALLRSLARNTANEFPASRLAAEAGEPGYPLAEQTVRNYLDALRRIHILKDQAGWNTHIRSRVRLISNPKRHLADPSIALAALGVSPQRLLRDGETLGFFFESLVVHDLRVFASSLGGEVYHYRDSSGLEVDAIIELRDSRWGAIEVKMPEPDIDRAAAHLISLKNKLAQTVADNCAFLAVVTPGKVSYVRPDGVRVISAAHLGA
jgi:predicted AAA+ superfamily ATPase